jgi:hypothetical protein
MVHPEDSSAIARNARESQEFDDPWRIAALRLPAIPVLSAAWHKE